ncbi:MAG: fibronectin type III domain-containing protein [Oscillospiraceae bacterium]|nr:fibronectin type III domain-containing protein [Oscillospiraceae bacterium]
MNATGGGYGGAGIGGGSSDPAGTANGSGGNITINGGNITATGNNTGTGPAVSPYYNVGGGAGIGGAGANNLNVPAGQEVASGASGDITINGGTINATGGAGQSYYGAGGAGIGSGGAGGDGGAVGILNNVNISTNAAITATGGVGSTSATNLDGASIGYGGGYIPPAGDPNALNVSTNGPSPLVGTELAASYTYNEGTGNGSGPESISQYQWFRSTSNTWDSNAQAISGATAMLYTPTGADLGQYLYFQVTPSNGTVTGLPMQSPASGLVGIQVSLDIVENGSNGTATINDVTGPVIIQSTTSPTLQASLGNAASVAWSVSTNGGTFSADTSPSPGYAFPTMDNTVTAPITITATFTASTPPSATAVTVTDSANPLVGTTLTGSDTYVQGTGIGDTGTDASTYQWYRSTANTWSGATPTPISGATSTTYIPTGADVGGYLYFEVTPYSGQLAGTPVQSSATGQVGITITLSITSSDTDETATINDGTSNETATTTQSATITIYNNISPILQAILGDSIGVSWTTNAGSFTDSNNVNPGYTLPTLDTGINTPITITATFTHPLMPSVANVNANSLNVSVQVGTALTASYDFTLGTGATSNLNESTVQWYSSSSSTWGTDTATLVSTQTVSLATTGVTTTFTTAYTPTGADYGMYLFFEVIPKNDTYVGVPVQSASVGPVGIEVDLNIINTGTGSTATTGTATINSVAGPTSIVVTPLSTIDLAASLGNASGVSWSATAGTFDNNTSQTPAYTQPAASAGLDTPITITATFSSKPPTADNVQINNTTTPPALVGTTLTGTYTYVQGTGSGVSAEQGTTFQWYRSSSSTWSSSAQAIAGATADTYTPTGADIGMYLYFQVTPSNGVLQGVPVQSSATGQVGIVVYLTVEQNGTSGAATINGNLGSTSVTVYSTSASPTLLANLGNAASVSWLVSTDGGSFANFLSTTPGYYFPSLNATVTTPITITASFTQSTPPYATNVNANSTNANVFVGTELTGSYTYNQGTGFGAGPVSGSTYQWYSSSSSTWDNTAQAISGATSVNYTPTASDIGNYLYFVVTPSNSNMVGAPVQSPATIAVPPPPPSISLSQTGAYTFTTETFGYTSPTPNTVTITNNGEVPTGNLNITLSGADASSFAVNPTSISSLTANGNTNTFTVAPNTGLAVGTYTATITVSGTASLPPQTFDVSFTVEKAAGSTPTTPPSISNPPTINEITVDTIQNTSNGQAIEYAISTSNSITDPSSLTWQSSTTFTGLLPGTTYYVYARTVQSASFDAGQPIVSAGITTAPPTIPDVPQGLTVEAGNEEIIVSWQPPLNDGGSPITGYRIVLSYNPVVADITVSATELTHTFTGLTNGLDYTVEIWALNSVGASDTFAEGDAIPDPAATPTQPTPIPQPEAPATPGEPASPPATPSPVQPSDSSSTSTDIIIPQTGESKITSLWLLIMLLSFISILVIITWYLIKYLNTVARNNK